MCMTSAITCNSQLCIHHRWLLSNLYLLLVSRDVVSTFLKYLSRLLLKMLPSGTKYSIHRAIAFQVNFMTGTKIIGPKVMKLLSTSRPGIFYNGQESKAWSYLGFKFVNVQFQNDELGSSTILLNYAFWIPTS